MEIISWELQSDYDRTPVYSPSGMLHGYTVGRLHHRLSCEFLVTTEEAQAFYDMVTHWRDERRKPARDLPPRTAGALAGEVAFTDVGGEEVP